VGVRCSETSVLRKPGPMTTRTAAPTKSGSTKLSPRSTWHSETSVLCESRTSGFRTVRSREVISAEVLAEAATAHLADLPPLFDAAPPAKAGIPTRAARRLPRPCVQVKLRLDGRLLHWLDAQVARLHARSGATLVLPLLRVHLGAPR